MITSWGDERRLTDADHGITAADTIDDWAEHAVKVDVRPAVYGGWFWEVYTVEQDADGEAEEWEVEKGFADTEQAARDAGNAARETYIRGLIRKG